MFAVILTLKIFFGIIFFLLAPAITFSNHGVENKQVTYIARLIFFGLAIALLWK